MKTRHRSLSLPALGLVAVTVFAAITVGHVRQTGHEVGSPFCSPASYWTALEYARTAPTAQLHSTGDKRDKQFGSCQKNPELYGYGTTRDYILKRDLANVQMNQYYKVQADDFADPYTGRSIHFTKGKTSSMDIPIDHIVAIQDA